MRIVHRDKIHIQNHERVSTILLTIVLQLQVFRRLSTIGYIAILGLSYLYWFGSIKVGKTIRIKSFGLIFLLSYLSLPVISLFNTPMSEYSVAIIRYGALLPYMLICMLCPRIIYDNLEDLVKVFTYIVVASAVLMIYQVPFGRISFFVEANNRVGYERYGSLLGSTTAYGTSSIFAFFYLNDFEIFKGWKKILAEVLILVGGILCLSKSFFINVALGAGLLIVFNKAGAFRKTSLQKAINTIVILGMIIIILYLMIQYTFVGGYFRNMMRYSFSSGSMGVETSLINRLTVKPENAFEYHNHPWYYYIFWGVGFKGYSGVLGLSQYPMCHNNYSDILLSQGAIALLSYLYFHLRAFAMQIYKRDKIAILAKQMIPYKLINMLAGLGGYLSVGGSLSMLIIYAIYNHNRKGEKADD